MTGINRRLPVRRSQSPFCHATATVNHRGTYYDFCRYWTPIGNIMNSKILNVLFLCESNSSLSIFGEAILNRMGKGRFRAYSAGSAPKTGIDEPTLYQLEHNNYAREGLRVNDWNDYAGPDAPAMDFVIALSDKVPVDQHPDWPREPLITIWRINDPGDSVGDEMRRKTAYARALMELESRISIFVNLPIDSLDRLKLQQRLNEIGG
jgi:protein-tyrosine-phosphatase